MQTPGIMWELYQISDKNRVAFQELCQKFKQSPGVFQCKHKLMSVEENADRKDDSGGENTQRTEESLRKKAKIDKTGLLSKTTEDASNKTTDIKVLQKMLIASLNNSETLTTDMFKGMEPEDVYKSDASLIGEEVLVQVCKKSEKFDDTHVSLLGKFLLLPKLCHLPHKLPTPIIEGLTQLVQQYTAEIVTAVLVPMLRLAPSLGEQHREVLAEMVPEATPELATQMLSSFSSRDDLGSESDIQILQLLCQHCDHASPASHTPVLTCLTALAGRHTTNVKFGQCLLYVAKNMAHGMKDLEALRFIISAHTSSLRKVIDITMRKLRR